MKLYISKDEYAIYFSNMINNYWESILDGLFSRVVESIENHRWTLDWFFFFGIVPMLTYEEESDLSPWEFTAHQTKLGSQAAVTCFCKGQESYRVSLSNLAAQMIPWFPCHLGHRSTSPTQKTPLWTCIFSYVIQSCIWGNKDFDVRDLESDSLQKRKWK